MFVLRLTWCNIYYSETLLQQNIHAVFSEFFFFRLVVVYVILYCENVFFHPIKLCDISVLGELSL